MTNLSVFVFNSNNVRVLTIDGEPWFVAKDLCNVLSINNPSQALSRLDDDEKCTLSYDSILILNDDPDVARLSAVSESGMYALVLSSRKPEAKPFRKWVTSEVLPTIRKTGSYSLIPKIDHYQELSSAVDIIFSGTGIDPRLIAGVKANYIAKKNPELLPAIEESKKLLAIDTEDKLLRPGKLAQIYESKTGIRLSAQKMNSLLESKGLQVKNTSGKNPSWLPTESGKQYSQLLLDTAKGHNKTVQSLQWYPSVVEIL